MNELQKNAIKMRHKNAQKWADYFASGKPLTPEIIKEIHDDNERLKVVCNKATKEWLQDKNRTY